MQFATEIEGLDYIKGKEIPAPTSFNEKEKKCKAKIILHTNEECEQRFDDWLELKKFMFAPEELIALRGKDHHGKSGQVMQNVRNHHINTFVDWAEERPRRRAIIIVDANQHTVATQIAKQIDIIGGDNTFGGLGLSETGKEPATHFWCNWNCSASEYDYFKEQKKLWWRVYDGKPYDTKEKINEFLATLSLKQIQPQEIQPEEVIKEKAL